MTAFYGWYMDHNRCRICIKVSALAVAVILMMA